MTENSKEAVIRCDGIWKIFGEESRQVMNAIRNQGLSKDEFRDRSDCAVRLRDTVTHNLLDANPAAMALFKAAKIDISDFSAQNRLIADGDDSSDAIDGHVADWIAAHQAEYDGWLEAARAAAN